MCFLISKLYKCAMNLSRIRHINLFNASVRRQVRVQHWFSLMHPYLVVSYSSAYA